MPEEWVELHNRSGESVSLAGWKLRGGVSFDFTAQSIPAGGYLLVARDAAALAAKYPAMAGIIHGPWSGSLSGNPGDTVILEDPKNQAQYGGQCALSHQRPVGGGGGRRRQQSGTAGCRRG